MIGSDSVYLVLSRTRFVSIYLSLLGMAQLGFRRFSLPLSISIYLAVFLFVLVRTISVHVGLFSLSLFGSVSVFLAEYVLSELASVCLRSFAPAYSVAV